MRGLLYWRCKNAMGGDVLSELLTFFEHSILLYSYSFNKLGFRRN